MNLILIVFIIFIFKFSSFIFFNYHQFVNQYVTLIKQFFVQKYLIVFSIAFIVIMLIKFIIQGIHYFLKFIRFIIIVIVILNYLYIFLNISHKCHLKIILFFLCLYSLKNLTKKIYNLKGYIRITNHIKNQILKVVHLNNFLYFILC